MGHYCTDVLMYRTTVYMGFYTILTVIFMINIFTLDINLAYIITYYICSLIIYYLSCFYHESSLNLTKNLITYACFLHVESANDLYQDHHH